MTLARRCTCIATLVLAATALATPTAWPRPVDTPSTHAETSVRDSNYQDLRSPDAIDAATHPARDRQDFRSPDAIDAATRAAYVSHTDARPGTTPPASTSPGVAAAVTAVAVACGLLLLGLIAAFIVRRRRTGREQVHV